MLSAADASSEETAPLPTMASAVFFGTVTFATVALATKAVLSGDDNCLRRTLYYQAPSSSYQKKKKKNSQQSTASALDLNSFASIYTLLHHFTILGALLFYAYLCEYHPPFPHSEKSSYDRDEFFFLTALLLVVSAFTLKKNNTADDDDNDDDGGDDATVHDMFLNRDQTEEWKGWMQFMFLLYHYFQAEELYNAVRIMSTCYLWMTGFGNFSFFYATGDYSAVRVFQMLWRLNFLVVFLCLTQGTTTYMLYYICPLHTYFFLMVYVTMRLFATHRQQHTSTSTVNHTKWSIRIKLFVLALVIFLIWDVNIGGSGVIFRVLHWPFFLLLGGDQPVLGAPSGAMWEWYFRSSLDHWSTFLGMLFALNLPITNLFFRKLEAQPLVYHATAKAAMGMVLFAALYCWATGPFRLAKFDYNQTNAYFGIVPLLTYIYFRNLTPWLRSHTLGLLQQIGQTTLETYLMQHHIWLTSNAKTLLTLIPGWPKLNFLFVSILYVCASRRLYRLTLFLRGMVLPNNNTNACLRNLLGLGAAIGVCLGMAWILKLLNVLNFFTVGICSVGFGFLLYHAILVRTSWSPSSPSAGSSTAIERKSAAGMLRRTVSPSAAGAFVVLLIGIGWHHMASIGATKTTIPLPATCASAVLQGHWIPIDGCNAKARGLSYREYSIASLGTCDAATTWGWEATPASEHCRFTRRDAKSLVETLKHRNVTFVGDSILRHLYHAMCRQLGDSAAGSYNTSMGKWSDFSRQYGNDVAMEFRWAPFVANLTTTVLRILRDEEQQPDLVVIGGGAWDRLHTYNTAEEQDVLNDAVSNLTQKLYRLNTNVPVTWIVPTTINSWALATEQKRKNIRENQMEQFRMLYRDKGIHDVVSFVLNGTSFTVDRVKESYDGVHYPLSVYDGGAQILANALDWLLPERSDDGYVEDPFITTPKLGSMDNPYLGVLMLIFVFIGIFYFDGFMGVSYIAALVVHSVAPRRLHDEAFASLHRRIGVSGDGTSPRAATPLQSPSNCRDEKTKHSDTDSEDDEMECLLSSNVSAAEKSSVRVVV